MAPSLMSKGVQLNRLGSTKHITGCTLFVRNSRNEFCWSSWVCLLNQRLPYPEVMAVTMELNLGQRTNAGGTGAPERPRWQLRGLSRSIKVWRGKLKGFPTCHFSTSRENLKRCVWVTVRFSSGIYDSHPVHSQRLLVGGCLWLSLACYPPPFRVGF